MLAAFCVICFHRGDRLWCLNSAFSYAAAEACIRGDSPLYSFMLLRIIRLQVYCDKVEQVKRGTTQRMPLHSAQELVHEYRFDMHTLHNSLEFLAMPFISIFKSSKSNFKSCHGC